MTDIATAQFFRARDTFKYAQSLYDKSRLGRSAYRAARHRYAEAIRQFAHAAPIRTTMTRKADVVV